MLNSIYQLNLSDPYDLDYAYSCRYNREQPFHFSAVLYERNNIRALKYHILFVLIILIAYYPSYIKLKTNMNSKNIDMIGGGIMIFSMFLALLFANSTNLYFDFINSPIGFGKLSISLKYLVKDILMIVFFVHIGMELRDQCHAGFLKEIDQLILPCMAAFGGMVVPIIIYLAININHPENYRGFAIPCATDIAFAICLFNIFCKRLPASIRVFLLSVAIFDDIGAILVIAIFYTNDINVMWMAASFIPLFCLWFVSKYGVANIGLHTILGTVLCVCFYKTGISMTLAGFLIGFAVPLYTKSGAENLKELMHKLHPFVQLLILPLFSFTSTGISFSNDYVDALTHPIVLGIVIGLIMGKQIGITFFSYLTISLKWAKLPKESRYLDIYYVSILAGIGFTMSLFIGMLAFNEVYMQNLVKIGVMAAFLGCVLFAALVSLIARR